MDFHIYGEQGKPTFLLLPGLGVSHEIFLPLVELLKGDFYIIAVDNDGFLLGKPSRFTSVDDLAAQSIKYVQENLQGHLEVAYGLSLGGKILSRMMERNEITIDHAIMDGAPLLPLPRWLVEPIRYYQAFNVWLCYHWTLIKRWQMYHSHYLDVLLEEVKKVYPSDRSRAVLEGYKSVYTNKLESIQGPDIHYWHGTKEAFVAKPQAKHLLTLCPDAHVEVFPKMNHGQLVIDHPQEVAKRIRSMLNN
jgi:pimeloyl-ACP methyl ester carboxylesterase